MAAFAPTASKPTASAEYPWSLTHDDYDDLFSFMEFAQNDVTLPVPTGSFDQGSFQHFLGFYSGITFADEAPSVFQAAWAMDSTIVIQSGAYT